MRAMLSDSFAYSLRDSGWIMIAIGAAISFLTEVTAAFALVGAVAALLWGVYFLSFYFDIVSTTVGGRDDPPDWPDVVDFSGEIMQPIAQLFVALVLSFAPAVGVAVALDPESASHGPALWAALAAGAFYFPMALVNVIACGEFEAALPHRVLPEIAEAMPSYLWAAALFAVVVLIGGMAEPLARSVPFGGGILAAAASVYFLMVQARVLGLLYRTANPNDDEEDDEIERIGSDRSPRLPEAE